MLKQPVRIQLALDCPTAASEGTVSITQGIAFPDRALARGAPVRIVDAAGTAFPTQAHCLATWGPDLRFVKWLLVDTLVPAVAARDTRIFLEHGTGLEAPVPVQPVSVRRQEHLVILSNGLLEITFRDGSPAFLAGVRVRAEDGWRELLAGGSGPCLYMVDQNGVRYDSCSAPPPPADTLVVEEEGPLRSSVCVKGFHAAANGLRFCPFVLRIHMFAGRTDLKVFHTFIFDQAPDVFELSSLGMLWPLNLGECQRVSFGGDAGSRSAQNKPWLPNVWRDAQWMADSDRHHWIELDGCKFGDGQRGSAWGSLQGSRGAVAVTLRDAFEEFPKAIRIHPDDMDIQLWPAKHGKALAFKNPWKERPLRAKYEDDLRRLMQENQTAGICWKGFLGTADVPRASAEGDAHSLKEAWEFSEKHLKDRLVSWGDTGIHKCHGLAKTHEFRLLFSAGALDDVRMEGWAAGVQTPPLATPDPRYICATGAVRLLSARNDRAFPEIEMELDHMARSLLLGPVAEQRLYGAIDYGDFVNCHARTHGFLYRLVRQHPGVKFTDLVGWFNNESTDLGTTLWQYYLRNGTREYWRAAEAYSEHQEDVDVVHAHPTDPHAVGKSNYHSMLHWSGGPSPSHTNIQGWLLHYYLTGNRRALEVAREAAEGFVKHQEPSGIYANRRGTLRREFTGPMAQLWIFYQATWEQRFLDCARRSLDFFVEAQDANGMWARDVFTDGERGDEPRRAGEVGMGAGNGEVLSLYDAYLLTGDERCKNSLLKAADYVLAFKEHSPEKPAPGSRKSTSPLYGDMFTGGAMVAFAYDVSGDERYLKAIGKALAEMPEDMRGWAEMLLRVPFQRALDVPQDAHAMMAAVEKKNK